MKLQIAAIRRKGSWRGALVEEGRFMDALIMPGLFDLATTALSQLILLNDEPDGTLVTIEVTLAPPAAEGSAGGQPTS